MSARLLPPDAQGKGVSDALDVPGLSTPAAGVLFGPRDTGPGVPLGGLGTGYIAVDIDGSWGQCTFANEFLKPRRPEGSPFRLEVDQVSYAFSTAARDGIVPALGVRYFGHYPVADLEVELAIPLQASVRAFSPLIPGDAAASNTPAAGFDVRLSNPSSDRVHGRLVFELPLDIQNASAPQPWEGDGLGGVQVSAPRHGRTFGHVLAGAARGGQTALPAPAAPAAVAFAVNLAPGQQMEFRFILSWCYPYLTTSDGHPRLHRYATRFASAAAAAQYLARNFDALLARVLRWQSAVYASSEPGWLKDWLVNNLYTLPKNTFWLADEHPDAWYGPDGLYTHSESHTGCPIIETIVCRIHGHFPALFFFPELERTTLDAFRHYQLPDGEIPFAFGQPTAIDMPIYRRQHPINSTEYVLLVHRWYTRTKSDVFLRAFLPSVRRALAFAASLDKDGDGLVDDHPHNLPGTYFPANQFYDCWPWHGASAYVAGIGLAALVAGAALAHAAGDDAFASECQRRLDDGMRAYRTKLWTGNYYRVYTEPETGNSSDAVLCNQLMGEWCTRVGGLGPLFPPADVERAIATIERLNVAATAHGAVNSMLPDGTPDVSGGAEFAPNIFLGEVTAAACTWMYAGRQDLGLEVVRRLHGALVAHRRLWDEHCLLRATDGGPKWGREYYSDAIAWAVPMARMGLDVSQFMTSGHLGHTVLAAGRATG